MSMTDKVRSAMVAAMKASDKETKESLSLLLSALKNKAIDKRADLTEEEEIQVVLKEIKLTLPMKYNVQHGYFFKDPLISRTYRDEREQAITDPVILHYSGSKPWFIEFEPPFKKDFAFYLDTSGLDKSCIRHIAMKARIKARFRSLLEKLGLIAPKDSLF